MLPRAPNDPKCCRINPFSLPTSATYLRLSLYSSTAQEFGPPPRCPISP